MASAKRTPKVSRISRDRTVAYARKQKPPAEDGGEASEAGEGTEASDDAPEPAAKPAADPGPATPASEKAAPVAKAAPPASEKDAPGPEATTPATPAGPESGAPAAAAITPPAPSVEPWPDATPLPMKPVDPGPAVVDPVTTPARASSGAPQKISEAATAVDVSSAEAPTRMPGPREIPAGNPGDPAPPPGQVPPGDSRSLRRRTERHEFVLIYRIQTYVISRVGEIGTQGQWRVVEYPTQASASHSYAKECSRYVSEGFSDYRA